MFGLSSTRAWVQLITKGDSPDVPLMAIMALMHVTDTSPYVAYQLI